MQAVLDRARCGRGVGEELVHVVCNVEGPRRRAPSPDDVQLATGLWVRPTADGTFAALALEQDDGGTWWISQGEVAPDTLGGRRALWRYPATLQERAVPDTWVRRVAAPEHHGVRAAVATNALALRMTEDLVAAGVPAGSLFATWVAPAAPEGDGTVAFHAMLRAARNHVRARRLRGGLEKAASRPGIDLRACEGCKDFLTESIPAGVWERLGLKPPVAPQPVAPEWVTARALPRAS